jgi:hypothetical protein
LEDDQMTRARLVFVLALSLSIAAVGALRADVRTEQRTKFQLGGVLGADALAIPAGFKERN